MHITNIKRVLFVLLLLSFLVGCASPVAPESVSVQLPNASTPIETSVEPYIAYTEEGCFQSQVETQTFLFFACTQAHPATGDYSALTELFSGAVSGAGTPELVLFGGDTINNGWDAHEWQDFWDAATDPLYGLTTAAVAGNHDNHPLLAEQFNYPDFVPTAQGEGFFYSLNTGLVHFLMLDSNIMGAGNERDIEWLRDELRSDASQNAAWRVAVMHHPMWTVMENPRDMRRAETMREYFLPLLEYYDVNLILCGHQHVYSRTLPMSGDFIAEQDGIVQIMVASGGKDTYTPGQHDYIAVYHRLRAYLVLTVTEDEFIVEAFDGEHNLIDNYVFT